MPEQTNPADTATQTEQISTVETVQQPDLDSVADGILELMGDENQVQNESAGNDTNEEPENNQNPAEPEDEPPTDENDDNPDGEQDNQEDEQENEDEPQDEDDNIDGFTPEQQAIFNKAQAKLRKKYQTARADRDKLQIEFDSVKAQNQKLEAANKGLVAEKTIVANVEIPLPQVQSLQELQDVEKQAWAVYQWAQNALNAEPQMDDDGNEYVAEAPTSDGKTQRFSVADVRKIAQNADATIRRDIPARKAWLEQNDRFDNRLNDAFPELKNPNSELSIAVNSALIHFPILKTIAGYREAALSFVLGQKLLKAHAGKSLEVLKKSVVPTKKATPAKPPVSRKPAVAAVSKKVPASQTATKQVYRRSTPYSVVDDIANYFES